MVHSGLTDIAFPVAAPSTVFASFMMQYHRDFRAQVIYLDGSHETGDVISDVESWMPFLDEKNPHSVIFGDDYTWKSVADGIAYILWLHCLPGTRVRFVDQWWLLYRNQCPGMKMKQILRGPLPGKLEEKSHIPDPNVEQPWIPEEIDSSKMPKAAIKRNPIFFPDPNPPRVSNVGIWRSPS